MIKPKIGDIYREFESQSSQYKIVLIALDFDTSGKKYLILEQLFDSPTHDKGTFWAVEFDNFFSKQVLKEDQIISENKLSRGAEIPRFVRIN